jgi:hypothetical protein
MATKNDLSSADWGTLRDTPYLVGFATVLAAPSGLGTFKELLALSVGMMENQSSSVSLLRDLSAPGEMEAARSSLKQSFGNVQQKPSPEALRQRALDQTRSSMAILQKNCTKEETDGYCRMLYGLAEKVASASREGGFLGFGGKQISEGEQAFLDDLRNTLQLEKVSKA